jgi:hypothetical protein
MKPDINIALMLSAQEISTRFMPLLEQEYDQSRLGSWGALLLLASLQIDGAADNLNKQNELMMGWLTKASSVLKSDELIEKIKKAELVNLSDIKISTLDLFNQKLRKIFVETQEHLEESKDTEFLKESWVILREMHAHRKVSHLLDLLKSDS